jgi:TrmH family RNA methyltransferase
MPNSEIMVTVPEFHHLRVVLVAPRNPLNIGAVARAMSNFGFPHLRVVNPYEVAFREARSAVGAGAVMAAAAEYSSLAEAVADCTLVVGTTAVGHRELHHRLWRLPYGARLIRRRLVSSPVALLFGSEKFGLCNDDLSHCHWLVRIPTRAEHETMNLGQAVAVCLYELARQPDEAVRPERKLRAEAGELERLTVLLVELLTASGYLNPRTAGSTIEKIRRLVRRLDLSPRDAQIWLGILRQLRWKLG